MGRREKFRAGFWLGHASPRHGGVGPYALRTLRALLAEPEPGWHFVLLCPEETLEAVDEIVAASRQPADVQLIPAPGPVNFLRRHLRRVGRPAETPSPAGGFNLAHQNTLRRWLDGLRLDLVHFPTPTPPHPDGHVPYLVPPLLRLNAPHVITVHDVQELLFPEYFSPAQRAIRAMHNWQALDQAHRIIVSYEHVKGDLLKYFRTPPEKIHVCPIPFAAIRWPEPTAAEAARFDEKYQPRRPFLLYPAQTWPHKNHARLLEALQEVRRAGEPDLRLICTGQENEHLAGVLARAEELGLGGAVIFTGAVPEAELAWLYRHTALVVVPTEYEAGSFPVLEAMALGVPVICSDVTSLPEAIGDRRFVFSPYDVDAMSELIRRMLADASLREDNVANGARRAADLRGVNAAAPFYAAYRSLLGAA